MRNNEIGIVHFLLRELHDVEIQRSGTPSFVANAPRIALDALKRGEQCVGLEGSLQRHHLIQIGALRRAAERLCLVDGARREQARFGQRGERCARMCQIRTAVADVRSERDEGDVAHERITRAPEIVARRATTSEELALTRRQATGIVGACQTIGVFRWSGKQSRIVDSLTAHYVARELGARWRGRRIIACQTNHPERTLTLWCEEAVPILFDLRALTIRETTGEPTGNMLRSWTILAVEAPVDDRRLIVRCERPGKFRGSPSKHGDIEISYIPNARGARVRDARRSLAAIGAVLPRAGQPRPVLEDAVIRTAVAERDEASMLQGRWMSSPLCAVLFARPTESVELYHLIVSLPAAAPVRCGELVFPLRVCEGEAIASLILPPVAEVVSAEPPTDSTSRAMARMRRELERAREAPRLRAIAGALMTLGMDAEVPDRITLPDGTESSVPRSEDPQDTPIALAERLYKEARAMERALDRLPARIAALEANPSPAGTRRRRSTAAGVRSKTAKRLPYKSYRTSGGIDVLVGRGAGSNDELTYEIAKPDDVWLHARDVTGAHVVMRWSDEGAPPSRDLHEAAALAAWYSRARGSVVVPVDWTRRRHVRRARGGPPGRALVDRARTVMARPTAELERRLRANEE